MSDTRLQPRSVIVTVFGAFVQRTGNWIAVADLVSLLGDLGIEEPSVRAAVARLKKSGLLLPVTRGSAAGYSAGPDFLEILRDGDSRIFASRRPADIEDGWVLASFSVPESERDRRYRLRTHLQSLGFGSIGAGVWIAPRRALVDARRILERGGLSEYVHLFTASYAGFEEIADLASRTWDFAELSRSYSEFLQVHLPVLERWTETPGNDGEAFVDYVSALERWRPLAYLDPGLPRELQPEAGVRDQAAAVFTELTTELEHRALLHVLTTSRRRG
ncbi:MAG TPA: PaaX family transcriptional regulator [Acidimicrobiales bacterium]|nr:PaaX family transcriptional regulator [Acidimicrobiales bacterium]